MPVIIELRLEERDDTFARMKTESGRKALMASVNATTAGQGAKFAGGYRDIVQDVLKRDPKIVDMSHPVGASGAASKNIDMKSNQRPDGYFVWEISEGNATPANALMRLGQPKGDRPELSTLRQWAANKGIRFWTDERKKAKAPIFQKSRGGKLYARSFPRTKDAATRFLSLVQRMIEHYGSNRPPNAWGRKGFRPHNWWQNFRKGYGRYDYPQYVLTLIQPDKALERLDNIYLVALVRTIQSGRKQKPVEPREIFGIGTR